MHPQILITLGDPNGIGLEVTLKALNTLPNKIHQSITLIGLASIWHLYKKNYPHIRFQAIDDPYQPELGVLSPHAGRVALKTLDQAISLLKTGQYQGLVTAPISKKAIVLSGTEGFIGHTEYLGKAFDVETEMSFWSSQWGVLLLTAHIPLQDVVSHITKERCEKIFQLAIDFNQKYYKGTVGVCGINPHAGEDGVLGDIEQKIITPVIQQFAQHYPICGPFSPDTIFRSAVSGEFSVIVAAYHDQALIPFKLFHFHDGVNVTLGLPFLRSSPDHGTAFDITTHQSADPQSMINAINFILKDLNLL